MINLTQEPISPLEVNYPNPIETKKPQTEKEIIAEIKTIIAKKDQDGNYKNNYEEITNEEGMYGDQYIVRAFLKDLFSEENLEFLTLEGLKQRRQLLSGIDSQLSKSGFLPTTFLNNAAQSIYEYIQKSLAKDLATSISSPNNYDDLLKIFYSLQNERLITKYGKYEYDFWQITPDKKPEEISVKKDRVEEESEGEPEKLSDEIIIKINNIYNGFKAIYEELLSLANNPQLTKEGKRKRRELLRRVVQGADTLIQQQEEREQNPGVILEIARNLLIGMRGQQGENYQSAFQKAKGIFDNENNKKNSQLLRMILDAWRDTFYALPHLATIPKTIMKKGFWGKEQEQANPEYKKEQEQIAKPEMQEQIKKAKFETRRKIPDFLLAALNYQKSS